MPLNWCGRGFRATLAVFMLVSWCCGPVLQAAPVPPTSASPTAADEPSVDAMLAELRVLQSRAQQAITTPVDAAGIVRQVGTDPAKLCQWVREQVAYEPYAGFMKGAQGAAVARRANSADKAMLLAALLDEAGIKAQLVKGTVDPSALPASKLPEDPQPAAPDDKALADVAALAGLSIEEARSALAEATADREQFQENLWTRFQRDIDTLASVLDSGGVALPAVAAPAVPADHWWVRTPAGDLDPTLEKAAGKETAVFDTRNIPASEFHRLTVRMKIRATKDDVLTLDASFRLPDAFGQGMAIANVPVDGLGKIEKLRNATAEQVLDALATSKQFQPQVMVGGMVVTGHPFDLAGNLLKVSKGQIDSAGEIGGAVGGGFGGMFGGGDDEPKKSELNANWIELEFHCPGEKAPLKLTRNIFTKGASPRQQVLDLISTREILVLPEDLSEAFVQQRALECSRQQQKVLQAQMQAVREGKRLQAASDSPYLNDTLFTFGLARRAELAQLCAARFAGAAYVHTRPTAVSYVRRFMEGKPPTVRTGIDILCNGVSLAGGNAAKNWRESFGLAVGVLDTALEHEVNDAPGVHVNASVLMEKAQLQKRAPQLVKDAVPSNVPAADAALLKRDLEGAVCIVIPGETCAWYQVKLDSGLALGYCQGGGQEMSEYAEKVAIILELYSTIDFYGQLFTCFGIGLTAPLTGDIANARKEFIHCMANIGCKKVLSIIKHFFKVEKNWTNMIIDNGMKQIWKGVCSKILKELNI